MVWMGMGDNDEINLFSRNPVLLRLQEEFAEITGMTWIEKNGLLSMDHISVTIVLIRILPWIGIQVFFKSHCWIFTIFNLSKCSAPRQPQDMRS
jgi:hypothetical protein